MPRRFNADAIFARAEPVANALDPVACDRGESLTVPAYSLLMAHPAGIVPIIGSQNTDRIVEATQSLEVEWSQREWYEVFTAVRGRHFPEGQPGADVARMLQP